MGQSARARRTQAAGAGAPLVRFSELADVNPRVRLDGLSPDTPVSFIPMSDVDEHGRWVGTQTRRLSEVRTGYTAFAEGDVLFAKITPCTENGKGCHATGLTNGIGFGSTEFHVLRPKHGNDASFVFQLSVAPTVRRRAASMMGGSAGQQRVPADFFDVFRVPLLVTPEQRAVANLFGSIDTAIERTRAVIEQVRVVKQALVADLMTNGLPGRHKKFKTVKGLGRIPSDWTLESMHDLSVRVADGVHQSVKTTETGIPFLYVSCVRDGQILWQQAARISQAVYHEIARGRKPCCGAILYTVVGSYGHAAVVTDETAFSFQRHVAYIEPDAKRIVPAFLCYWLNSAKCRRHADRVALGNAQKTITLGELRQYPVPTPPIAEQAEIVQCLNAVDRRMAAETCHRDQMLQLKSALSDALLTGRIRVVKENRK